MIVQTITVSKFEVTLFTSAFVPSMLIHYMINETNLVFKIIITFITKETHGNFLLCICSEFSFILLIIIHPNFLS